MPAMNFVSEDNDCKGDKDFEMSPTTTLSSYTSLKEEFSDHPLLPAPVTTSPSAARPHLPHWICSISSTAEPVAETCSAYCDTIRNGCYAAIQVVADIWNVVGFIVSPLVTSTLALVIAVSFVFLQSAQASWIWDYFHANHSDFADVFYVLLMIYCGFVVICGLTWAACLALEDGGNWRYAEAIGTLLLCFVVGELLEMLLMLVVVPVVLFVNAIWTGWSRLTGGRHVDAAAAMTNDTVSRMVSPVTVSVAQAQETFAP